MGHIDEINKRKNLGRGCLCSSFLTLQRSLKTCEQLEKYKPVKLYLYDIPLLFFKTNKPSTVNLEVDLLNILYYWVYNIIINANISLKYLT